MVPATLPTIIMSTVNTLFALIHFCIAYWLFLLWRKTGDGAFVWLMAGIGLLPSFEIIFAVAQRILQQLGITTGGNDAMMIALFVFLSVTLKVMAFGFIVMGLRQIAGGCIGIRTLFSWRTRNSFETEEAR